jgi:hypothetical protein
VSASNESSGEVDDGLGAKFWWALIGITLVGALGFCLVLLLFGMIWYAWGLLAALITFVGITLLVFYYVDRRARSRPL